MAAVGGAAQPPRQYKLAPQSELRVEVPPDAPVRVRLVAGTAEVFGTELPPEGWVPVPPRSKIAIFTWHGATVELDGVSESEYTSDETPMVVYVNTHAILDARRARARAAAAQGALPESSQGPRVIIVGPSDSGKSTLCKMLLSWAAKQGWKPTYVDLDIGQGSITIPGCISATPIEKPIDIVDGIPLEMPLAYFYGHPSPRGEWDGLVPTEEYSSQIRDQSVRPKLADELVPPGTSDGVKPPLCSRALPRETAAGSATAAVGSATAVVGGSAMAAVDGSGDGGGGGLDDGGGGGLDDSSGGGLGGGGSIGGEGRGGDPTTKDHTWVLHEEPASI
ncbi:hypothetical protein OsI_06378 [Oryza sativa Indica Group]|uniref:Protein CLP1 homolog n=1 Tax=Oryza sativa subsp. indica TaxID=39946 RepID=B8AE75_ORYSI|nr:hypothetical protein OsI_06378 [Oryza sativa Indica Group]